MISNGNEDNLVQISERTRNYLDDNDINHKNVLLSDGHDLEVWKKIFIFPPASFQMHSCICQQLRKPMKYCITGFFKYNQKTYSLLITHLVAFTTISV